MFVRKKLLAIGCLRHRVVGAPLPASDGRAGFWHPRGSIRRLCSFPDAFESASESIRYLATGSQGEEKLMAIYQFLTFVKPFIIMRKEIIYPVLVLFFSGLLSCRKKDPPMRDNRQQKIQAALFIVFEIS